MNGPNSEVVTDAIAATAPIVLLAGLFVLLVYTFGDGIVVSAAMISSIPQALGILVAAAIAIGIAAALPRRNSRQRSLFYRSGTAAVSAFAIGIAIFATGGYALLQGKTQTETGIYLAQDQMAQVIASSVRERNETGIFPKVETQPGTIAVTTSYSGSDEAQYIFRINGIPGVLLARVGKDGKGQFYWQDENTRKLIATLIAGRVQAIEGNRITVQDLSGEEQSIVNLARFSRTVSAGEGIVAVRSVEDDGHVGIVKTSDR